MQETRDGGRETCVSLVRPLRRPPPTVVAVRREWVAAGGGQRELARKLALSS